VDEFDGVIEPDELLLESLPPKVRERLRDLVVEAYKLPGRLLLVLDLHRLLAAIPVGAAPGSALKDQIEESHAVLSHVPDLGAQA